MRGSGRSTPSSQPGPDLPENHDAVGGVASLFWSVAPMLAGARRCPPENVGGTHGFMEFLEAVLDASHEEHDRMTERYGGPFDPEDIDEQRIRLVLGMAEALRDAARWLYRQLHTHRLAL